MNPVFQVVVKLRSSRAVCVCSVMLDSATPCTVACEAPLFIEWNFPGKNTGVVCHFILKGSS